jgi:hypothetical protein
MEDKPINGEAFEITLLMGDSFAGMFISNLVNTIFLLALKLRE